MDFSDQLRFKIAKKYDVDLNALVWDANLTDFLMGIKLNTFEDAITTMAEVYEKGFNIGCCGLTCRYFALALPKSRLMYGIQSLLIGTKNSKKGNHAWIINGKNLIDPTLKIIIPVNLAGSYGYTLNKELASQSARYFSDEDLYSKLIPRRERNIEKFNEELLMIK